MLINIGIIIALGLISAAMIYTVDRKVMREQEAQFKMNRSFKTSKLKYTGGK